eukprot:12940955-Ditylum_brightwellii.AAC.1
MGGYDNTGKTWCFHFPHHVCDSLTLNTKECLAAVITIELSLNDDKSKESVLCLTDSSLCTGWLHKSSFSRDGDNEAHDKIACHLTNIVMTKEACLFSQYILGEVNDIINSFMCSFLSSCNKLTYLLKNTCPHQTPLSCKVSNLLQEIAQAVSWIGGRNPTYKFQKEESKRSKILLDTTGTHFFSLWDSTNHFAQASPALANVSSLVFLCMLTMKESSAQQYDWWWGKLLVMLQTIIWGEQM